MKEVGIDFALFFSMNICITPAIYMWPTYHLKEEGGGVRGGGEGGGEGGGWGGGGGGDSSVLSMQRDASFRLVPICFV